MIANNLRRGLLEHVAETGFMAYHGSPKEINKFVDDFVGANEATDQEGPGIYFTTEFDDAAGYGKYVYSVRLRGKYLVSTGDPNGINKTLVMKLAKMAEDWKMEAQNYHENPNRGIIELVNGAYEYNEDEKGVLQQIWINLYRYRPVEFVRNCVKLGIDGIIVDRYANAENGGKHIIIYNPNTIEYLEMEVTE